MRTFLTMFVSVWILNSISHATPPLPTDSIKDSGLFNVVFRWDSPDTIRRNVLPPNVRQRVDAFVSGFKAAQAKRTPVKGHFEEEIRSKKETRWIDLIVALSSDERSMQYASEFTRAVGIMYEWEGMSEGPLSEAQAAEMYLTAHPDSPISPVIFLFLAHRFRAASECLLNENQPLAMENTKKKSEDYRNKALGSADSLVRRIAEEMGIRETVYLEMVK